MNKDSFFTSMTQSPLSVRRAVTNGFTLTAIAVPFILAAGYFLFSAHILPSGFGWTVVLMCGAALLIANIIVVAHLARSTTLMSERLKTEQEAVQILEQQNCDLKKRLIESDKLPSLSILVGGVSHEIRTPLTSIMGFAELALQKVIRQTATPDEMKDYLKTILQSADHCLIIVQDLLDFARPSGAQKVLYRSVNMNSCIESTVNIIMHHMKIKNIGVIKDFDTNLPPVRGNYNQLRQVLLNLLMNARDAIRKNGKIRICSRTESDEVVITIEDDGEGIDRDTLEHIFEPFFTTKEPGKGTGLGLVVSQGLIQEHNGSIGIESTPDVGTTVTIRLPAEASVLCSRPRIV